MNFEDVAYAMASFFTLYIFVFIPINMLNLGIPGLFIAGLIPALIVGYIFASKIASAKKLSIAKILVLATVLVGVFLPNLIGYVDWDNYLASNPNTTLPASEFMVFMGRQTFIFIAFNLVLLLLAMFIGLFIGTTLKTPTKRVSNTNR